MKKSFSIVISVVSLTWVSAAAQDANPMAEQGKKPSAILAAVEERPDFLRLVDMSWNDKGYYEIEYRTRDKAKVQINIEFKSGKPVEFE